MQTINYKNVEYRVIEVLASQIESLTYIDVFGAAEISEGVFKFYELRFSNNLNGSDIEVKSFYHSRTRIEQMNNYANPQNFNFTWAKFQKPVENEIVSLISSGLGYTPGSLMHEVMIPTTTFEMNLESVYQALILTNGNEYANYFKEEMLSNIDWLINMIETAWDEYDIEDAV